MTWDIELTTECERWWESLTEAEQDSVAHAIDMLATFGPSLARPYADTLKGARYPNMKELRAQHEGRPYRVLYAFDPRRVALLLLGGDKTGNAKWYETAIREAEELYRLHLDQLKQS